MRSRREVLEELSLHLHRIGSANDAEDHNCAGEANRMRRESCDAIRALMAVHPFLEEMFPKLLWELDTRHILGWGWSELSDSVEAYLRGMKD